MMILDTATFTHSHCNCASNTIEEVDVDSVEECLEECLNDQQCVAVVFPTETLAARSSTRNQNGDDILCIKKRVCNTCSEDERLGVYRRQSGKLVYLFI